MNGLDERIRHLYPFDSHFLEKDGLRLHYLDEGTGPPVVLLHGNPSWSFMYRNLVFELRSAYRVIVPDHIGCGLSSQPTEREYDFRLARRVADLQSLIEHLQLDRPSLVVHDWGGLIGFGWATRHPDQVSSLVVLNTAAFRLPEKTSLHWTLRFCRNPFLSGPLLRGLNAFSLGAGYLGTSRGFSADVRRAYLAPYDSWGARLAVHRFVQDIPVSPDHPSYGVVREMEARLSLLKDRPMLVCWGERDFIFDRDFLARWRSFFPAAEVESYPDAGHYVIEDASAEVIPRIHGFLDRTVR